MRSGLSVLVIATQTWFQITRLALRFADYGCGVSVICPGESHLTYAPGLRKRFRWSLRDSIGALHRAILDCGADFLLPTDDLAVWYLHELADRRPELRSLIERSLGSRTHWPVLRSRMDLLQLASRLGIAVPATEVMEDSGTLERWCVSYALPCVLKKDGTWGGSGVEVAASAAEAQEAFARLTAETSRGSRAMQWLRNGDASAFTRLRCFGDPSITVQSFVRGVPANAMYACHEGCILGEVQACVTVSTGDRGPSLAVRLMRDSRITRAGALLAGALKLSGFFGLDFMIDEETGEPLLIELNPRSTRLGHIAAAGQPDLAGLLWAQWSGAAVPMPAAPGLPPEVCFYPDGERLSRETGSLQGCRADVPAHETEMLRVLLLGNPALRSRLRGRLWRALVRLKGSLHGETQWQPFFHREPPREEIPARAEPPVLLSLAG